MIIHQTLFLRAGKDPKTGEIFEFPLQSLLYLDIASYASQFVAYHSISLSLQTAPL